MRAALVLGLTVFSFIFITGFSANELSIYWETQVNRAGVELSEQSYCFEDSSGVQGQNIDQVTKPASVSKLYTTLWAIEKLGPQFRFKTEFKVVGDELYILGGSDPYFVSENIMIILDTLFKTGIKSLSKIHFNQNFSYNWTDNSDKISKRLYKVFNTKNWDGLLKQTYHQVNKHLEGNGLSKLTFSSFSVGEVILTNIEDIDSDVSFSFHSSPMVKHLKQVNMYSNNFYTDALFDYLGGEESFNHYISNKLNTNSTEIYFYTGSGLGDNYTTCRLTLRMLEELELILSKSGISKEEIMAVPGSDAGTMEKRFRGKYNKMLVAKTGTLNDTSAFSGFIFNKDNTRFAVLNRTSPYADKTKVRKLQDNIVKQFIKMEGDLVPINYSPSDYISIDESRVIKL